MITSLIASSCGFGPMMCFFVGSAFLLSFDFFGLHPDFWFWTHPTLIHPKAFPWFWILSFLLEFPWLIHFQFISIISLCCSQLFLECPPQGLHNLLHIFSLEWSLSRSLAFTLPWHTYFPWCYLVLSIDIILVQIPQILSILLFPNTDEVLSQRSLVPYHLSSPVSHLFGFGFLASNSLHFKVCILKVPINEHTYSLQLKRTLHTQVSRQLTK